MALTGTDGHSNMVDTLSSVYDQPHQRHHFVNDPTLPHPQPIFEKKDTCLRQNRTVDCPALNRLHAVFNTAGKRSTQAARKLSIWEVGSKDASDNWNNDFEFPKALDTCARGGEAKSQSSYNDTTIGIPGNIKEQQINIITSIGLLRKWGLLIEELKCHRDKAIVLGALGGPHGAMWDKVDATIDLADQDAKNTGVLQLSFPSSLDLGEYTIDDVSSITSSIPKKEPFIFRLDSEAKAQYVMESLHRGSSTYGIITDFQQMPATQKVLLDTATLQHIIPYVVTLTTMVMNVLRDAEDFCSSAEPSESSVHSDIGAATVCS
jgi:hypothetical protein